ncbi:tyrosine/serine/threonine protein phosphatase pps1, partial [Lunasporangiospora selenospora]
MVTTAIHPGPGANFISDSSKSIQSLPDGSAAPMTSYPDISQPAIRTISSDQLAALHRQFVSTPLPSKDMFPWLHGVDGTSAPQNFFFGLAPHHFAGSPLLHMGSPDSSPSLPVVPEHRGLMFVYVNEMDPGRLVGSVNPYEILQPAPPSSPSAVSGATPDAPSDLSTHDNNYHPQVLNQYSTIGQHQQLPQQSQTPQDQEGESHKHSQQEEQGGDWIDVENSSNNSASFASSASNDLDASSNMNNSNTSNSGSPQVEDTVPDNPHAGLLLNSFMHSLSDGVNIRNFKIQVPRYALLSDIVVYSKDGFVPSSTPNATATNYVLLEIARQISTAQEAVWKTMKERCPQMDAECRRQTFVLAEPFAALEEKYPELVAVSSSGMASKHKVDFWEQEREQMSLLTRASEIAPGIW